MVIWLRLLVVLLLASFATGSYAQTTAATTMAFKMPAGAIDMDTPAPCGHCKPGIVQHAGSCALCLAAIILPSAPVTAAHGAASSIIEIPHYSGYEGEPLSPVPPPPRTIILS